MKKKAKASKAAYRIEYFVGTDADPYFARLCSVVNGQTIATSEGYSSKTKRAKTWNKIALQLDCEIVNLKPKATK